MGEQFPLAQLVVASVSGTEGSWFESREGSVDYGTSQGIPLTDELIEQLSQEAENGYDLNRLRERNAERSRSARADVPKGHSENAG